MADQNTDGALLEVSLRTAMQGTSLVWSEYLFAIITKVHQTLSSAVLLRWVRRWTTDDRAIPSETSRRLLDLVLIENLFRL